MIRKFNYTNRKKIGNEAITIILNDNKREKNFEPQFYFQNYNFPDHAKVYVEAYYKTNYMRFAFGSVSFISPPPNTTLTDFVNTDLIYFRVKIVDETTINGRLLALASGLEPKNLEGEQKNRISILKVNYDADLGQRLYHLELDEIEDLPILEINKKLDNGSVLVTSDVFISTIYTSVIHELATEIINDNAYYQEDDECWEGYWLKYFKQILGVRSVRPKNTDDDELKKEWIEEVINSFCNKYKVRTKFTSLNLN
jgi:hypothetical protein